MTYPAISTRIILSLMISLASFQLTDAQVANQPLAVTKLPRLLRIPTMTLGTDAGEFIVYLDSGTTGVALDPLMARLLVADRATIAANAQAAPLALDLNLGKLHSKVSQVAVFDLGVVRENVPEPVFGIVGMSVLRDTCLRCDFDSEQLSLLSKTTGDFDEVVDVFFAEGGRPHVIISTGRHSFPVMIDIGAETGLKVPIAVYEALESPAVYTIQPMMSSGGVVQNRGHKAATVKMGSLKFENVSVSPTDDEYGLAGLKFLCRMNLELDFPRKQMRYQPSKRIAAKDNDIRFGLSAAEYYGSQAGVSKIVAFVGKGSAAQAAGIRPGDLLVCGHSEFYGPRKGDDLYRMLGLPRLGPTMVEVQRDDKLLKVTLD